MKRKEEGFTLIEVIVVAGIIAILAGILVPIIFKEIDESKKTRAIADIRSISSAMFVMKKDTGSWPTRDSDTTNNTTLLRGQGDDPLNAGNPGGWNTTTLGSFDDHLMKNTFLYSPWPGPYMASVSPDPWGKMYICNIVDMAGVVNPVWIISAGPNGVVDTPVDPNQTALGGDDIGLRIK